MSSLDQPDVVIIGSGIMSANLGFMLKQLDPKLSIQLYEVTDKVSQEASDGWNNAGTGHAGICEISYTPDRGPDGEVDVTKAISVFQEFLHSKLLWAYAVREGLIKNPKDFINPVPHMSFVHGAEQVDFLKSRYKGMAAHHFFEEMEFSTDPDQIAAWAPLLMTGRGDVPVAATKMMGGTDINFGSIARKLVEWLGNQPGCKVSTGHRVVDLDEIDEGWSVTVKDLNEGTKHTVRTKFVFVGAGGGSLPLLQKAGIKEAKGYGGFPIAGQWLVTDDPKLVDQHNAKVYGQALGAAPTMAVPHLDTRVIDGKSYILFGPFGSWTTKFLHKKGSFLDMPLSVKPNNITTLIQSGLANYPLVEYLVGQCLQSMQDRLDVLREFFPDAVSTDWDLIDAGIRVQAIKKTDGKAGIVHFGTEVLTNEKRTISSLLGASPGASVCVNVMLDTIKQCFPELLESPESKAKMNSMVPVYGENLLDPANKARFKEVNDQASKDLELV